MTEQKYCDYWFLCANSQMSCLKLIDDKIKTDETDDSDKPECFEPYKCQM